ncbi:MAG: hypothetical protein ABJG41_16800 [Cyclobacteriaceae bacterium]
MRNLIIISYLVLLGLNAHGQIKIVDNFLQNSYLNRFPDDRNGASESLIHCRDGSQYIGSKVGMNGSNMLFRLNTTDTINVPVEFIKKYLGPDDIIIYNNGRYHLTSSWFLMLSNGYSFGWDFTGQVNALLGWRFNKQLAAGIGTGFESHEGEFGGIYLWDDFHTVYGYGRFYISERKKRIYLDSKLGYGIPVNDWGPDNHTGGALIQPGIGLIYPSRRGYRWFVALSNLFQYTSGSSREFDSFSNPIVTKYKIWYKQVIFTVGIEIH